MALVWFASVFMKPSQNDEELLGPLSAEATWLAMVDWSALLIEFLIPGRW
jgi:hypothetical protein